ncbi:hypothetical protein B0A55_13559, partial [Friedmanniomyces simplex]
YFEVRYFLTVTTSLSNAKPVSVQLPIILVHMNSLDVVPNSIAQVAAAIEEKRAEQHRHHRHRSSESKRCKPGPLRQRSVSSPARSKDIRRQRSYTQGRAFAAPRQQSLDRQRAEQADLDLLRQALDASPRGALAGEWETAADSPTGQQAQGIEGRTIAPHVLGLSSGVPRRPSFEVVGMDAAAAAAARPATGQGFRERLDRSRFEFKAVRRKGSVGGMRERGWGWWEQMRPRAREREREREREDGGWI